MIINSKFNSKCKACNGPIKAGERINWSRNSGAHHLDCAANDNKNNMAVPKIITTRFVSAESDYIGQAHYRNSRGRCEDAPCCGCCS